VKRTILLFAGVLFLGTITIALAQQAQPVPAAVRSEVDCSGFIAGKNVPEDITVLDGADDDFNSPIRLFTTGDYIFLRAHGDTKVAVGTEYALVRNARFTFEEPWYEGQHASIRSLGHPYDDVGRVRVTSLTPLGAVAQVTFACGPVFAGDIALPYQPRPIPEYTPTPEFDPFALPNGKVMGAITAAGGNSGAVGERSIVFINLGQEDGVQFGQRFRIFRLVRDRIEGLRAFSDTPRESTGELIILSTQEKSSVGIVIRSTRDISLGDGIELE